MNCKKVLLVYVHPSNGFSVSSDQSSVGVRFHFRLFAFVDRQENYVLLLSPSRCE